jgi:hypothetical protein
LRENINDNKILQGQEKNKKKKKTDRRIRRGDRCRSVDEDENITMTKEKK